MPDESDAEFLFQVLDSDEHEGEPPFFSFFKRTTDRGDIPIFIKTPQAGWLWSEDPVYGVGDELPPSDGFETIISTLMDDTAWRTSITSDEPPDALNPEFGFDDSTLASLPIHEEYIIQIVREMVKENHSFPPKLEEYLIQTV